MRYKLRVLDGPMPHPPHYLVFELKACVDAPVLTEEEMHALLGLESVLERVMGYRFHILYEE